MFELMVVGAANDYGVFHRPQLGIAVPALEGFPVKQQLETFFPLFR